MCLRDCLFLIGNILHGIYRDKFLVLLDAEKTLVPWVNVGPLQT